MLRNLFIKKGLNFKTSMFAKNKTLLQVITMHIILIILIINEYSIYSINLGIIYYVMIFCTIITVLSGFDYINEYFHLKKNEY